MMIRIVHMIESFVFVCCNNHLIPMNYFNYAMSVVFHNGSIITINWLQFVLNERNSIRSGVTSRNRCKSKNIDNA